MYSFSSYVLNEFIRLLFAGRLGYDTQMRVILHQPKREVVIKGPRRVCDVLEELKLRPETVLVIRGEELATEDEMVRDEETLEIRPVISGGGLNFDAL